MENSQQSPQPTFTPAEVTGKVKEEFDRMYLLMAGVIMVLFVGFIALLITVWGLVITSNSERVESFEQLKTEINELNQNGR
jgi:hypothetical protein